MVNSMNGVGGGHRRSFVPALLVMAGLAASVSGCKGKPRVNFTVPAAEIQKNNSRVAADGFAFRAVRLDTKGLAYVTLEQFDPQKSFVIGNGWTDYKPIETRGSLLTFQVPYGHDLLSDPVSYKAKYTVGGIERITGVEVKVRTYDPSGNWSSAISGVFSDSTK